MQPRDVFISYTEQDGVTARALAAELRALHLTTWTYEEDGVVGISYLTQINAAIESCRAFVLLASPQSVNAHQVISEVEQAHEREKVIIPTRVGLSHQEFIESNPILRMACGTAVTLAAEDGKLAEVAKRIAAAVPAGVPGASRHYEQRAPASPGNYNRHRPGLTGRSQQPSWHPQVWQYLSRCIKRRSMHRSRTLVLRTLPAPRPRTQLRTVAIRDHLKFRSWPNLQRRLRKPKGGQGAPVRHQQTLP
jgi:hypothetical protein